MISHICAILSFLSFSAATDSSKPGILSLDLKKNHTSAAAARRSPFAAVSDSDGHDPISLLSGENARWYIELQVGSQKDTVDLLVDTGSAALWVPTKNYDPSQSTTFHNASESTNSCNGWSPNPGSCSHSYKAQDDISIANAAHLTNATFNINTDIVDEATMGGSYDDNDENFPMQLKHAGITERAAYALWLDAEAKIGVVSFGGIDTEKYTGTLGKSKIVGTPDNSSGQDQYPSKPGMIATSLNAIKVKDNNGNQQDLVTDMGQPVWFDTGSDGLGMRRDWLDAASSIWGCWWDDTIRAPRCDYKPDQGSIIFDFSGVEVELKIAQLSDEATTSNGRYQVNGKDQWYVKFEDFNQKGNIVDRQHAVTFGEAFFEQIYVAIDLDGDEIAFAQPKQGVSADSNPVAIDSNGIPSCTEGPNYSASTYHDTYTIHSATPIQTGS